jgi:hypothetical protein
MNKRQYGIFSLWIPFVWCIYGLLHPPTPEHMVVPIFFFLVMVFSLLQLAAVLQVEDRDPPQKLQ